VSKRLGSPYVSRRTRHWLKFKNPAAPAVKREGKEFYCGGMNEATTIDHMPPITIFDHRQRPRGLESSACKPCNSGGRLAEQIVGL
jgi:hypothetical protein